MYYQQFEDLAIELNKRYYPKRLEKITPVDVYDFSEMLGIEYEWKYITPDDSILGLIFFDDGYWPVWPSGSYKKGDIPKNEIFKKGTIVINQILLDKKELEKETFVVCHEIMHFIKDQEFFSKINGDVLQICSINSFGKTYWSGRMNPIEIVERQTNYLTAAFLMHKDTFAKEFFRIGRYKNIPIQPIEFKSYMKGWIKTLANELNLNYNPVLYRLYDLNVLIRA